MQEKGNMHLIFSRIILYYGWNEDNYGPIWMPVKGATVKLDTSNLCLYERIIDVYEENDLQG